MDPLFRELLKILRGPQSPGWCVGRIWRSATVLRELQPVLAEELLVLTFRSRGKVKLNISLDYPPWNWLTLENFMFWSLIVTLYVEAYDLSVYTVKLTWLVFTKQSIVLEMSTIRLNCQKSLRIKIIYVWKPEISGRMNTILLVVQYWYIVYGMLT